MEAFEIRARRLNATEILTSKKRWKLHPTSQVEQQQLFGRDQGIRKSTFVRGQPEEAKDLRDDLRGEWDVSQPMDTMMDDREARNEFWSMEGNYVYRHHVEPRVQLYVLEEE